MSAAAIAPEPVPLVRDLAGRLMVAGTRISLDVLVADFKRGKTPEWFHDAYQTVALANVYAIFAYYLRHRAEVEAYLVRRNERGARSNSGSRRTIRRRACAPGCLPVSSREAAVPRLPNGTRCKSKHGVPLSSWRSSEGVDRSAADWRPPRRSG